MKEDIKKMSPDELRKHIKEITIYLKNCRDLLKEKVSLSPKISIATRKIKNEIYIYVQYAKEGKKYSSYMGKFGSESTREKLLLEYPHLVNTYDNMLLNTQE